MSLQTFKNSFLKNGILQFWSGALIIKCISTHFSDENYVHNQNMIPKKIVITNFPDCKKPRS